MTSSAENASDQYRWLKPTVLIGKSYFLQFDILLKYFFEFKNRYFCIMTSSAENASDH